MHARTVCTRLWVHADSAFALVVSCIQQVKLYRFRVDEEDYTSRHQQPSMIKEKMSKSPMQPFTPGGSDASSSGGGGKGGGGKGGGSADGGGSAAEGGSEAQQRSRSVDLRPLVLAGHGRDARTAAELQGLSLPAGVHLLPVFLGQEERIELWDNMQAAEPHEGSSARTSAGDAGDGGGGAGGGGSSGSAAQSSGSRLKPPFDDLEVELGSTIDQTAAATQAAGLDALMIRSVVHRSLNTRCS